MVEYVQIKVKTIIKRLNDVKRQTNYLVCNIEGTGPFDWYNNVSWSVPVIVYLCADYKKSVFKKMPSRSTNPVYKGDSGDLPLHIAFISRHKHNKVRAYRGSAQADDKPSGGRSYPAVGRSSLGVETGFCDVETGCLMKKR